MFAELILAGFIATVGGPEARPAAPAAQHAVIRDHADGRYMGTTRPMLQMAADLGCSHYSGDYDDRCYRRRADPYYGRYDERHDGYEKDRYGDRDHYDDDKYGDRDKDKRHDWDDGDRYGHDKGDDRLRDRHGRPYHGYRGDEDEDVAPPYRRGAYDRPGPYSPYDRERPYDYRRGAIGDEDRFDPFDETGAPDYRAPGSYYHRSSYQSAYHKKKDTTITAITTRPRRAGSDAGSTV